jgi:hypothetical protein
MFLFASNSNDLAIYERSLATFNGSDGTLLTFIEAPVYDPVIGDQ